MRGAVAIVSVLTLAGLVACGGDSDIAPEAHASPPSPLQTTSPSTPSPKATPTVGPNPASCEKLAETYSDFLNDANSETRQDLATQLRSFNRVSDSPWMSEQSLLSSEAIDAYLEFGGDSHALNFNEAIAEVISGCAVNDVPFADGDAVAALEASATRIYRTSHDLLLACGEDSLPVQSFEEAWEIYSVQERESCVAVEQDGDTELLEAFIEYDLTSEEQEAVAAADYGNNSSVIVLHHICAESHSSVHPGDWSENQAREMLGALELCPKHPDRETIEAAIEPMREWISARAAGELYEPGTHRVPDGIPPGTYVAESLRGFDGCYWERLDVNGNILGNNFMNSGFRAEVTISPGDFSFHSARCGEWMRLY